MSQPPTPASATDLLAEAALTPEQRRVWDGYRRQLEEARQKAAELERRLKALEHAPPEEQASVLTRPEFNREVARMLALDERYGGSSSVLYFDFDRLDDVADKHGKAVANAAVREIATIMTKHVRSTDIVGRLAPDEFGVLLVRCSNTFAWQKAEELAALLRPALLELHGCRLAIDIQYGAYTFRANEDVALGLKEAAAALTQSRI